MWKTVILLLLIHHCYCGRVPKPTQELIDKIEATFSEIKLALQRYNTKQISKLNLQSDELLEFVSALRDLHDETLPLIQILMGPGSDCIQYLNKIPVGNSDLQNLTKLGEVTFENIGEVPDADTLVTLNKTINTLQSITKEVDNLILAALNRTQDSFEDIFTNLFVTQDLTDFIKQKVSRSQSDDVIESYFRTINLTLESTEQNLDEKIRNRQEQMRVDAQMRSRTISRSKSLDYFDKNFMFRNFQCHITEIKRDDDICHEYLSENDIDTLHKSLHIMKNEFLEFKNEIGKSPKHAQLLDYLSNRIKSTILKIKQFYSVQEQRENDVFAKIHLAISTNKVEEISDLDTSVIKNKRETKKIVQEMYGKVLNLKKVLEMVREIEDLGTAFYGVQAAFKAELEYIITHGGKVPKRIDRKVIRVNKEMILDRFKLSFTGKLFSVKSSKYIYDLYKVQERYADQLMHDLADQIDHSNFMISDDHYIADVILFLDLNLQLILRNKCNLDLYSFWYRSLDLERFYKKVKSYIDLVKIKLLDDPKVIARCNILSELIWFYARTDTNILKLSSCTALERLQAIKVD